MKSHLKSFILLVSFTVFGFIVYRTVKYFDFWSLISHPGHLAAACFFQFLNVYAQFLIWTDLSRDHSPGVSQTEFYKIYAFGSVSRYLPIGKVAQLSSIIVATQTDQRARALVSFVEWTLSGILSGLLLTLVSLLWVSFPAFLTGLGVYALMCLVLFLAAWEKRSLPQWVLSLLKKIGKGEAKDFDVRLSRRRILRASIAMFLFSWTAEALAAFFLFGAAVGVPTLAQTMSIVFSNTVSYFGGMFVFFIPNGLGIREAMFVWISQHELGETMSEFIPLALRSTVLFCEVLFFIPLLWIWKRSNAQKPRHQKTKEEVSRLYKIWTSEDSYPHFLDQEYDSILRGSARLNQPGQKVLDVGCGVGRVAAHLKRLGHTVHGFDLVPECVDEAIKKGRIDQGFVGDALKTGLPSESYDVILYFGVLLHIFDLKALLSEASRLLKPGGEVVIFDHHSRNPYVKLHFNRPDWFDRLLEGRSNAPRHPLNEKLVVGNAPGTISWSEPVYFSLFTQHPNRLIQLVHQIARLIFKCIRICTKARWTGNMVFLVGKKTG